MPSGVAQSRAGGCAGATGCGPLPGSVCEIGKGHQAAAPRGLPGGSARGPVGGAASVEGSISQPGLGRIPVGRRPDQRCSAAFDFAGKGLARLGDPAGKTAGAKAFDEAAFALDRLELAPGALGERVRQRLDGA